MGIHFTKMNLHIFNPEHDIALGYNRKHLTIPHTVQELRMNLGWLPAIWASDGDVVLVDDAPFSIKAATHWHGSKAEVLFLSQEELKGIQFDAVVPWGWDSTLCDRLEKAGVSKEILPSEEALKEIRQLSNRRTANKVLLALREELRDITCGDSAYVTTSEEGRELLREWKHIVVKSPWSCSGRGIRYIEEEPSPSQKGFIHNVMKTQGGMMVEPYYNKVMDFGMEFKIDIDGHVDYLGLSLFHTVNGAYTGNLLATETEKREMLARYIDMSIIDIIRECASLHCQNLLKDKYMGPFGIDMMIVKHKNRTHFLVHPCVEINLRRTMGHVALSIPTSALEPKRVMTIEHDVNYCLKVNVIENCFVKTL